MAQSLLGHKKAERRRTTQTLPNVRWGKITSGWESLGVEWNLSYLNKKEGRWTHCYKTQNHSRRQSVLAWSWSCQGSFLVAEWQSIQGASWLWYCGPTSGEVHSFLNTGALLIRLDSRAYHKRKRDLSVSSDCSEFICMNLILRNLFKESISANDIKIYFKQ